MLGGRGSYIAARCLEERAIISEGKKSQLAGRAGGEGGGRHLPSGEISIKSSCAEIAHL